MVKERDGKRKRGKEQRRRGGIARQAGGRVGTRALRIEEDWYRRK